MATPTIQLLPTPPQITDDGKFFSTGAAIKFFQILFNLLGPAGASYNVPGHITSISGVTEALVEGSQWPVGSMFISVNNVNPNGLLGFGTWTLAGTGTLLGTTVYMFKRDS